MKEETFRKAYIQSNLQSREKCYEKARYLYLKAFSGLSQYHGNSIYFRPIPMSPRLYSLF